MGTGAAKDVTTGHSNTAVGKDAFNLATTASYNTLIGHDAGLNISLEIIILVLVIELGHLILLLDS